MRILTFALAIAAGSASSNVYEPLFRGEVGRHRRLQQQNKYCADIRAPASCDALEIGPECLAARSPEFCPATQSFPTLIKERTKQFRTDPSGTEADGYWFQFLEDKAASFMLTANSGLRAPEIFCCFTNPSDLADSSVCSYTPGTPVVVKASDKHSNVGIYVFPGGIGGEEFLTGDVMTEADVINNLINLDPAPSKIILEEYIDGGSNPLPMEFKLHMFGSEVGAIDVIANRGTDCACYAVIDTEAVRLDQFGCFEPTGIERADGNCYDIDFTRGLRRAGPVKGDLPLCSELPYIDPCLIQSMTEMAQIVSSQIGVYIRVDMFVNGAGDIFVQEYSPNHMGGYRHCVARENLSGCIDSCILGAMWESMGSQALYGGPDTALPGLSDGSGLLFDGWSSLTDDQQCALLLNSPTDVTYSPNCAPSTQAPTPLATPAPSPRPSERPTGEPVQNILPAPEPTPDPTSDPTPAPTLAPTASPTAPPVPDPTPLPTEAPTPRPVEPVERLCVAGFTPLLMGIETKFTSFSPSGAPGVTGVNTNELRWGNPATAGGKSGVRMDPAVTPFTVLGDEEFSLGSLTHFNNPIYAFDGSSSIKMNMDATLKLRSPSGTLIDVDFPFMLTLDETNNNASPCPYGDTNPCADRLTFPLNAAPQTFTLDGVTFGLEIEGFFQNAAKVDSFISDESLTNTATLLASLKVFGCDVLPAPPKDCVTNGFVPMLKGMNLFFDRYSPPNAPGLTGLETEELRWGNAATNNGQSGVRMDAAISDEEDGQQFPLVDNGEFVLGTLTHFNNPIYSFEGIHNQRMVLNAELTIMTGAGRLETIMFPFDLTLDETVNNANPCPYGDTQPCADRLSFPLESIAKTFVVDGVAFGVEISGFYQNDVAVDAFVSDEELTNSAILVAKFMIVGCAPESETPLDVCVASFTPMMERATFYFDDFNPSNAPYFSGLNTEELRWGQPATSSGSSGVRMDEANSQFTLVSGGDFTLGTLTHFNNPVYAFDGAQDINMRMNAELLLKTESGTTKTVMFPFRLTLDETPNNASPCPYGDTQPCADRLTFPLGSISTTFEMDGVTFGVEIVGFFKDGNPVDSFVSDEQLTNRAKLIARLIVVGCTDDIQPAPPQDLCKAQFTPLLTSVDAFFNDFIPVGAPSFSGTNTQELRWGSAATSSGRSGVRIDPVITPGSGDVFTLVNNGVFRLGTLAHFNNPIYSFTGIDNIQMTLNADLTLTTPSGSSETIMFPFRLTLDETPNNASPCPYGGPQPCADRLSFPLNSISKTFTLDDVTFGVEITGFFQNNVEVDTFDSDEQRTNEAVLLAKFMVIGCAEPAPTCPPSTHILNFDEDARRNSIPRGTYVGYEWLAWGVEVSAIKPTNSGYVEVIDGRGRPRIFDTSNPGTNANGDPDLASDTLGNILILQESNKDTPDDNAGGGFIEFRFAEPVDIEHIDIMDVDGNSGEKVTVTGTDGDGIAITSFQFSDSHGGDGHGKLTRKVVNLTDISYLKLRLHGSMAVAELKFTTPFCE